MTDDQNANDSLGQQVQDDESNSGAVALEEEGTIIEESVIEEGVISGARLVVKRNGIEVEDMFDLNPPSIIGRFDPGVGPVDVDLGPLPEGVYVSRKHARITCEDDVWTIEDMGSSNGTFILRGNDFERVESVELTDGTEFALGNARFVFHLS
jgi:hypothetical protein